VLAYATDLKGILDDYSFMNQTEQGSSSCAPVLLRPLIETLAPNATRSLLSDRTLRCSFTGQEEELLVDSQLLSRVITHLLSNATRYSPAASVIELALESNGAEVTLRVSNACLPAFNVDDIAASLHSSLALFQTYISEKERGRGSLTYSHGLGFGLACCSKMVRALGGELACSFLDDKRQVSFSFTLQLLRVESHRSLSRSVEGLKRGRRILVVDDSRVCRKVRGQLRYSPPSISTLTPLICAS
jgi:K+-sensing histidine kinase KdpD